VAEFFSFQTTFTTPTTWRSDFFFRTAPTPPYIWIQTVTMRTRKNSPAGAPTPTIIHASLLIYLLLVSLITRFLSCPMSSPQEGPFGRTQVPLKGSQANSEVYNLLQDTPPRHFLVLNHGQRYQKLFLLPNHGHISHWAQHSQRFPVVQLSSSSHHPSYHVQFRNLANNRHQVIETVMVKLRGFTLNKAQVHSSKDDQVGKGLLTMGKDELEAVINIGKEVETTTKVNRVVTTNHSLENPKLFPEPLNIKIWDNIISGIDPADDTLPVNQDDIIIQMSRRVSFRYDAGYVLLLFGTGHLATSDFPTIPGFAKAIYYTWMHLLTTFNNRDFPSLGPEPTPTHPSWGAPLNSNSHNAHLSAVSRPPRQPQRQENESPFTSSAQASTSQGEFRFGNRNTAGQPSRADLDLPSLLGDRNGISGFGGQSNGSSSSRNPTRANGLMTAINRVTSPSNTGMRITQTKPIVINRVIGVKSPVESARDSLGGVQNETSVSESHF
jgi:hypothetical protein